MSHTCGTESSEWPTDSDTPRPLRALSVHCAKNRRDTLRLRGRNHERLLRPVEAAVVELLFGIAVRRCNFSPEGDGRFVRGHLPDFPLTWKLREDLTRKRHTQPASTKFVRDEKL